MADAPLADLARSLAEIVRGMPAGHVHAFVNAIVTIGGCSATAVSAAETALPNPTYRYHAQRLAAIWQGAPGLTGYGFGLAVLSALELRELERASEQVELVATGPSTPHVSLRQTRAVILELVSNARSELVIVSFSAFRVPELVAAMAGAAARGVKITLIVETTGDSDGWLNADAVSAFDELRDRVQFFCWPQDRRPAGVRSYLHAKAVIGDATIAFVTSANVSAAAFDHSLELGVLIRGGSIPRRLADHFLGLMASGDLRPLA